MDFIKENWYLLTAAVAHLVWLIRLENRANSNSEEVHKLERRLERQRDEDLASNRAYRDEIKDTLGEIRQDIKMLLKGSRDG